MSSALLRGAVRPAGADRAREAEVLCTADDNGVRSYFEQHLHSDRLYLDSKYVWVEIPAEPETPVANLLTVGIDAGASAELITDSHGVRHAAVIDTDETLCGLPVVPHRRADATATCRTCRLLQIAVEVATEKELRAIGRLVPADASVSKGEQYRRFWAHFLERVRQEHPEWTRARGTTANNWVDLRSPLPGTKFAASFANRSRLRYELYIDSGNDDTNADLFEQLRSERDAIEEAFGGALGWEELPNRRASRVAAYLEPAHIEETERHAEFIEFLLESGVRLRRALAGTAVFQSGRGRTLHDALRDVLRDNNAWMSADDLAGEVNARGTYRRGDGQPIEASQVHARTAKYPTIFEKHDGLIRLRRDEEGPVRTFRDDDSGFLAWADAHPNGYFINTNRNPRADYLILHSTACPHFDRSPDVQWTRDYIKICSDSADALNAWARDILQASPTPCQTCLG